MDTTTAGFQKMAYTFEALDRFTDRGRTERASACSVVIYNFDPTDGTLQTSTSCAVSADQWSQLVEISDWEQVKADADEYYFQEHPREMQPNPDEYVEGEGEGELLEIDQLSEVDFSQIPTLLPTTTQSNVRVFCECPDFLYSGAAYKITMNQSQYVDEMRPPQPWKLAVGNMLCKHLVTVYMRFFQGR